MYSSVFWLVNVMFDQIKNMREKDKILKRKEKTKKKKKKTSGYWDFVFPNNN